MKKYKKIIICLSCVLLLVISFVLPCFAYEIVDNNSTAGQNAYRVFQPISFDRGVLTCYDVVQSDFSQVTNTIMFDMPISLYKDSVINYLSTSTVSYDSSVYPYSAGCVNYNCNNIINNGNDSVIGVNIFGNDVKYSHRQKLELYCQDAFLSRDDFDAVDSNSFSKFQITVNAMESITRFRVLFDVAVPRFEVVGYDPNGIVTEVKVVYDYQTISYDIDNPISVSQNGAYLYEWLNLNRIPVDAQFGLLAYKADGTNTDISTVEINTIHLKNIRLQVDGTRHFSINNLEPNYDYSFSLYSAARSELYSLSDNISTFSVQPVVNIIDFQDVNLIEWMTNLINDFFNVRIMPNISLGAIFWFIVGLGLFFFILKVFMGG